MKNAKMKEQLSELGLKLYALRYVIFAVIVLIIYTYTVLNILNQQNSSPSATTLSKATSSTQSPQVNPATVAKINQLKNNSVSVKALFNQARQNPFSE